MRYLIFFALLLTLATLACNSQNNDDLPTLAPTPAPLKSTAIATAVPAASQSVQPTATRSANATTVVQPTAQPGVTGTPQADKGDDLDKLLDELNNALKNFDTMDDVK